MKTCKLGKESATVHPWSYELYSPNRPTSLANGADYNAEKSEETGGNRMIRFEALLDHHKSAISI